MGCGTFVRNLLKNTLGPLSWRNILCAEVQHAQEGYPELKHLGIIGLTVTLFLIGTGLSKETIRKVGVRPMLQGVLLWIVVAAGSLALIRCGWIHL